MVNRLMDLVVIVAEMSQSNDKSLKELDKELTHLGYSSEEIEQAISWISSQWPPIDRRDGVARDGMGMERPVFRVLSPWEALSLDSESYGYLLRLQNLGIVDDQQMEKILGRIPPHAVEKLSLGETKALAGSVIFNLSSEDSDEDIFDDLDDDYQAT